MVPSVTRGKQLPAVVALLRLGLSRSWWRIASNERVLRHPQARDLDCAIPSRRMVAVMNDRASSAVVDADLVLADGRRVGYAVWGEPEGQPALLFHGSPESRLFCPDPVATAAAGSGWSPWIGPATDVRLPRRDAASWTGPQTSSNWSPRWVSTACRSSKPRATSGPSWPSLRKAFTRHPGYPGGQLPLDDPGAGRGVGLTQTPTGWVPLS
jgi:hypothetical protein